MIVQRGYATRPSIAFAYRGWQYAAETQGQERLWGERQFISGLRLHEGAALPKLKGNRNILTRIYFTERKEQIKGVIPFNIIVHYPEDKEMQRELARRVAVVHAQSIVQKVKSLACPFEQKIALLDAVKQYIKSRDGG